jgi:hypothetical protein
LSIKGRNANQTYKLSFVLNKLQGNFNGIMT